MVGSTAETAEHEAAAEAAPEAAAAAAAEAAASPVSAASAVTSPAGSPVEVDGPRASPQPNRPRNDAAYTLTGFAAGSGDAEEMSCGKGAPGLPRPSAGGGDNQPTDGSIGEGGADDAHCKEACPPAGVGGVASGLRHCYVGCEASAAATGEGGLGGGTLARGHPSPDFLRHGRPTDVPVG